MKKMKNTSNKPKVKYVKTIKQKGYPTANKDYATAHRAANASEKKANPKMFNQETKAERKLKPKTDMATHSRSGKIEIENKYKKFTPNLVRHEKEEFKKDKQIQARKKK